jgi:MFS family permease
MLALEVVGFRFLLLFIDGTSLVFAVMLAVVLAGIGLGALTAARVSRRRALTGGMARAAAAAVSVALVGAYAAYPWLLERVGPVHPQSAASAALLCAFLLAPAAFLSGFLFTALGERLRSGMADAGAATGALTLANTLGAMLGSLLAAFVLLPVLGLERSFFALALVFAAAVLAIPAPEAARWRGLRPALAAALALALFPFGTMAEKHWRGSSGISPAASWRHARVFRRPPSTSRTTSSASRCSCAWRPTPTRWPPPPSACSAT